MAKIEFVDKLPSEIVKESENLNEIPNKIRFLVEAAPNMESKVATLEKFYNKVEMHPTQKGNFIVTNEEGEQLVVDNKNKTNLGDVIDVGKEVTEIVGSMVGTSAGATAGALTLNPVGVGAGAIVGSGVGMAAGAEIFEKVGQMFGTEILRTNKEHAAQRMTDFAFGSVGQAVAPLILKGFKGAITGFGQTGKETSKRLEYFIDAGVTPSLGQVTQKRSIQTMELILGNFPGSSGRIATHALKAQDDLGAAALKTAKDFIGKNLPADEVAVGRIINTGIKDGIHASNGFVGRFQAKAGELFGVVDKYIKPKSQLDLKSTIAALEKMVLPVKGTESTTKVFRSTFLTDILKGLEKDLAKNGGTLPYSAIKSIKGKIGNKISSLGLMDDVAKADLKTVYGAISEDIKFYLKGSKKGLLALSRANKYYATGLKRIENFLTPISKVKNPDTIASLLINTGREGATRLNAIKKSLTPAQYNVFLSNVVERMGRLQPGQALSGDTIEAAGKFSSETFLTNYNRLSPAAKEALFSGKGWTKGLRKDFDDILQITNAIRQSGRTFKNPSGTADRVVGQGIILGGGASAFTGNPVFLVGVLAAIGGANVTSRLFTNPSFIKWLAEGTKISATKGVDGIITHLGKLGIVMGNADSETRQFIHEYLQMLMGKKKEDVSSIPNENTTQTTSLPNTIETQNVASLPTPPLDTVGVNPASFDNKIMAQDANGLTQSEQAFLDDEEKAMRLRSRGMTA